MPFMNPAKATRKDQVSVPLAYVRGGTSKACVFHEYDLPTAGPLRDRVLKRIMGTPDPTQIDGLGGTKSVTSKIAIISRSDRDGIDVDYTFAQVGVKDNHIFYDGNCGNVSAAVGPFAIDEGLISTFRKGHSLDPKLSAQEVRIFNTGTKKMLIAHVPVDEDGCSIATGSYSQAGVPGRGAPILLDYRETAGASRDRGLLPTGNPTDTVDVCGSPVEISICDIANIAVFARADELGITGHEPERTLTGDKALLGRLRELRGKAAVMVGLCTDWRKVDQESCLPLVVLVAEPPLSAPDAHISARLFIDNTCHDSMAGTGAICTTACSRIQGSVVNKMIGADAEEVDVFNISHPLGIMPVAVQLDGVESRRGVEPSFKQLSFIRTSRRILDGKVYVPKDVLDGRTDPMTKS